MSINTTRLLQFSQQFSKFYHHRFEHLMAQHKLSMREIQVLLFLANNPDYDTARSITELRGISKSQVSQAVDLLAAEGMLLRTPDKADRRMVHLSITPAGLPIAQSAQEIQSGCAQALVEGLSPQQLEELQTLLETVLENGARLAEEV